MRIPEWLLYPKTGEEYYRPYGGETAFELNSLKSKKYTACMGSFFEKLSPLERSIFNATHPQEKRTSPQNFCFWVSLLRTDHWQRYQTRGKSTSIYQPCDVEGKYEVIAKIGEGNFSEVYVVRNRELLVRHVAKVNLPLGRLHDKSSAARAIRRNESSTTLTYREAGILTQLGHYSVHVPRVFDVMRFKGRSCLLLENIAENGWTPISLENPRVRGRGLENIFIQLLDVAKDLQDICIIHGDLKPSNILYFNRLIKVVDFALALYCSQQQQYVLNRRYNPPEALQRKANQWSDLWSIGLVMYYCATGKNMVAEISGASTPKEISKFVLDLPKNFTKMVQEKVSDAPMGKVWKRVIAGFLHPDPEVRAAAYKNAVRY